MALKSLPGILIASACIAAVPLGGCASDPPVWVDEDAGASPSERVAVDPGPLPLPELADPDPDPDPPEAGVRTLYTVTLKRFPIDEAMDIIRGMREFRGYQGDEPMSTSDIREYRYWSAETLSNVYEWLVQLLSVRYRLGTNVVIATHENAVEVLKKEGRFN